MSDPALEPAWLPAFLATGHGPVARSQRLVDGTISHTRRLQASDGFTAVVKERTGAPPDLFRVEADALDTLRTVPGWTVPAVLGRGLDWLLLEDLGPQVGADALPFPKSAAQWEVFGRALARCHGRTYSRFGWDHDTYWGLLRFDNRWRSDGYGFYRETRFAFLLAQPGAQARLTAEDQAGVERVSARLDRLVPLESPCLNHGDLWAGNRMRDRHGGPAVIDPFIHAGLAAWDLHNCRMYGGFPTRFWDAYRESRHLPPDWANHADVFNLLHCLACVAQGIEVPWHGAELRRLVARFG